MTTRFVITLDECDHDPDATHPTRILRQKFEEAWRSAAPAVIAVPGLKLISEGRFQRLVEGDERARQMVDDILSPPLKTADIPPTPTLF